MPPFVEVVMMTILEVFLEVKLREVDVALGFIEFFEDLSIKDRLQELYHFVSLAESVINGLTFFLQLLNVLVELIKKLLLLSHELVSRLRLVDIL